MFNDMIWILIIISYLIYQYQPDQVRSYLIYLIAKLHNNFMMPLGQDNATFKVY